jgi:hypothetical protein
VGSSDSNGNTALWETGFAALCRFRAREGHCCPWLHHFEGNVPLGAWVTTQRYYKDRVLPERKRRLKAIGFVWDWHDYVWEQNFAALLKFKRREGHCCVPILHNEGNITLGYWSSTQRRNKKEMSSERRARLDKIGFVWNAPMGPPAYRAAMLRRLSAPNSPRLRPSRQALSGF